MNSTSEYIAEERIFHGLVPHVMGTRLELIIVGVEEGLATALWDTLHDLVFRLDRVLNRFDPESDVSVVNMADNPLEMPMGEELAGIVGLALEYRDRTCGLFDITYAGGKLDFGGFGKGYFLKKCDEILRKADVTCAFVDFGNSSILGIGHHPYGEVWQVGVVDPYTRRTVKTVNLRDSAMSTSGNAPSYSSHIQNPHTGELCEDRKLVCVISDNPLDAEVLSTVLMIAGPDEKDEILSNFPAVEISVL